MINPSLPNSVRINPTIIKDDDLFSTGPKENCYWMMDLGSSMHVKVVLIIGDYNDEAGEYGDVERPNTKDWYLTVGENSNPLQND